MSDQNSIRDDISYMRQLAETGRKGPILGGVFLAAAGVIFGSACVIDWAVRHGLVPMARSWSSLYIWIAAFAVFGVFWGLAVLRMTLRHREIASAPNATFGTIWAACGIGVMVAFGTTVLIARDLHASVVLSAYVPVIYAFYGTAWFASGALAKRGWMHFAGIGSFAYAFVIALLTQYDVQSLAMGGGLFLLLTLPGLKLMREARS